MTRTDRAILDHLRTRRRSDPASISELRDRFGGSARDIKAAVERIRQEHLIGASRGRVHGYWWPDGPAEVAAALAPVEHQAIKMLRMVKRWRGGARVRELCGQATLDLGSAA